MTEPRRAAAVPVASRILDAAPVAAQVVGTTAAVVGLYLLVGLAWTLLAGGLAVVAVATLAEMRAS